MSTIVTRAGKGSPLTHAEVDSNFTNLNSDKVEASGGTLTNPSIAGVASFADGSASAPAITNTGDTNTGIFFPAADTIAFAEGGAEAMRLDSSGNLGLGVTPSAWSSAFRGFQVRETSVSDAGDTSIFANNWYFNGSNVDTYIANGTAQMFSISGGAFAWRQAGSGTAGNAITFTQAMTLDASGRLGIGDTSPSARLSVKGSGASNNAQIRIIDTDASGATGLLQSFGSGFDVGTIDSYPVRFVTANTERMRIDSSGNLLVNTTNLNPRDFTSGSGCALKPASNGPYEYATSDSNCVFVNYTGSSSGSATLILFRQQGFNRGSITTNGTTVAYNTSSDYRLKEDIAPMTGALAMVSQLKPCTYTWKETGKSSQGFIAHELAEIIPDAVTGEKDAVNEDGSIAPQGIDTSFLVATLTAAIQELKAEVDSLKAQVENK